MKRYSKYYASTAIAVLVASGFTPIAPAEASSDVESSPKVKEVYETPADQFTYTKTETSVTITGYTGTEGVVIIPNEIEGLPVESIGERAFSGNTVITDVKIGDNVKKIGLRAFLKVKIKDIHITNTELTVDGGFNGVIAETVTFAEGTKIVEGFKGATVGVFTIPDNVELVRELSGLNADNLVFGENISKLNYGYKSSDSAFMNAKIGKLVIPASLKQPPLTGLNSPFYGASIKELTYNAKNGVTPNVKTNLFGWATIDKLVIPDSTDMLPGGTFYRATIKDFDLGSGLKEISEGAFERATFSDNTVLDLSSVEHIKQSAFLYSNLTGVSFDNIITISENAFRDTDISGTVVLPKSLLSIGHNAFNSYDVPISKLVVLNKYLTYLDYTSTTPIANLGTTGGIYGYEGSTTQHQFMGKGFRVIPPELQEPTISSNLINGQTYNATITPTFDIKYADNLKYTLNGEPYDGVSPITKGGSHTLKVEASNELLSATKTYNFTVVANLAPKVVGTIEDQTAVKGNVLTIDLKPVFNDPEGDKLSYEVTTSDDVASKVWTNTKGELKFSSDIKDSYDITVKATDGFNYSEEVTFTVTVGEGQTNTAPEGNTIPNQAITLGESKVLDVKPYFTDKESDALTFTATSDTALDFNNGVLDMSKLPLGTHTINVKANDGKLDSTIITFTVEVKEPAPEVKPPTLIGSQSHNVTVNMTTNPEGKTFNLATYFKADSNEESTFKILGANTSEHFNVELNPTTGELKVTPLTVGSETVQVYAENSAGMSTPLAVNVNITETSTQLPPPTNVVKPINPITMEQVYYLESGQSLQVPISRILTNLTGVPTITINDSTPSATTATADTAGIETGSLNLTVQGMDYGFGYHEILAKDETGLQNSMSVSTVVSKSNYYIDESGQTQIRDAEIDADNGEMFVVPLDKVFGTVGVMEDFEYLLNVQKKSETQLQARTMRIASAVPIMASNPLALPPEITADNLYTDGNISIDLAGHNMIITGENLSDYDISVGANVGGVVTEKPFNIKVLATPTTPEPPTDPDGGNNGGEETDPPTNPEPPTNPGDGGNNGNETEPPTNPGDGGNESEPPTNPEGGDNGSETEPPTNNGGGNEETPPTNPDGGGNGGGTEPPTIDNGNGNGGGGGTKPPTTDGVGTKPPTTGGDVKPPTTETPKPVPPVTGETLPGYEDKDEPHNYCSYPYSKSEATLEDVELKFSIVNSNEITVSVKGEDLGAVEIKDGKVYAIKDCVAYLIGDAPNNINIDYSNARAIRDIKGNESSVMHYTTGTSLILTTSNLEDVIIVPRVKEPFLDVLDNNWFKEDTEDAYNYLFVKGTTPVTYEPNENITRGQFAGMIARALEITHQETYNTYTLKDLKGKWYANEVQKLVDLGILSGFEDGTFKGHETLTRQQASSIILKTLKYLDVDTTINTNTKFADESSISGYAKDAVQYLAQEGILVSGDNVKFNPHNNITRAQMSKILMQSLKHSDKY